MDAADQLIQHIPPCDPQSTIVLGIPRGGVPMAARIASALHAPMDILMVKKLATPENPEYAIGAVSLQEYWVEEPLRVSSAQVVNWVEQARAVLRTRDRLYRKNRPFPELQNKIVLLIDDGVATGRTLSHAIQLIRSKQPKAIWVAVPVCSREAAARIVPSVERFISLHQPSPFIGVGRFYRSFPSVNDSEVILEMERNKKYTNNC
jgi:predicted phosphoribosyltransferase